MKKRKRIPNPPKLSFPETSVPSPKRFSETLSFSGSRCSGKLGLAPPLAYSLDLPNLPWEESNRFFQSIRENFFLFLTEESQKKRTQVMLGVLDWSLDRDQLILSSFYGEFQNRRLRPVASFTLDSEGRILSLCFQGNKPKKKRSIPSKSRKTSP